MPDMDGFEVCRAAEVRSRDRAYSRRHGHCARPAVGPRARPGGWCRRFPHQAGQRPAADDARQEPRAAEDADRRTAPARRYRRATSASRPARRKRRADEAARPKILLVDDRPSSYERIVKMLATEPTVDVDARSAGSAVPGRRRRNSTLRDRPCRWRTSIRCGFARHLRSLDRTRFIADHGDRRRTTRRSGVIRALDLGVNDYLRRPIDRKNCRRACARRSAASATTTICAPACRRPSRWRSPMALTGLHNRRYLDSHLQGTVRPGRSARRRRCR